MRAYVGLRSLRRRHSICVWTITVSAAENQMWENHREHYLSRSLTTMNFFPRCNFIFAHHCCESHSSVVRNPLLADIYVVAVAAGLALCDVLCADFLLSFFSAGSVSPSKCSALRWKKTVCRLRLQLPRCDNNKIMPWFYNKPSSSSFKHVARICCFPEHLVSLKYKHSKWRFLPQ